MPAWNLQFNGDYIHEDGGEAYVRQPSGVYVRRDLYTGRDLPPIDHLIQQNPVESIPLGAQNFAQLLDVPDYAPDVNGSVAGRGVEVNAAANGLAFALGLKLRCVAIADTFQSVWGPTGYIRLQNFGDYPLGPGFGGGAFIDYLTQNTRFQISRAAGAFVVAHVRANLRGSSSIFSVRKNRIASDRWTVNHTAQYDEYSQPSILFSEWLAQNDYIEFYLNQTGFVPQSVGQWGATVFLFW